MLSMEGIRDAHMHTDFSTIMTTNITAKNISISQEKNAVMDTVIKNKRKLKKHTCMVRNVTMHMDIIKNTIMTMHQAITTTMTMIMGTIIIMNNIMTITTIMIITISNISINTMNIVQLAAITK